MRINSKIVSDRFDDEVVVVSLETGVYYSFKGSSIDIWSLMESDPSGDSVLNSFKNITAEEQNDILLFIDFLIQEKLITKEEDENINIEGNEDKINFSKIEYSRFNDMADLIMIDPIHEVDDKKGWPNKAG